MTQEIEKELKGFLEELNFDRIEWDGREITAYHGDQPFGMTEFTRATSTRHKFVALKQRLRGLGSFEFP